MLSRIMVAIEIKIRVNNTKQIGMLSKVKWLAVRNVQIYIYTYIQINVHGAYFCIFVVFAKAFSPYFSCCMACCCTYTALPCSCDFYLNFCISF